MSIVEKAAKFAIDAHGAQKRKYTGESYTVHLEEVAELVNRPWVRDEVIAAAWLHDVLEDTDVTSLELINEFGLEIAEMVSMLTDFSLSYGNRAKRKAMDRARLAQATPDVQTIKLADIISNTRSIAEHDSNFASKTYLPEVRALLDVLTDGDAGLMAKAKEQVQ